MQGLVDRVKYARRPARRDKFHPHIHAHPTRNTPKHHPTRPSRKTQRTHGMFDTKHSWYCAVSPRQQKNRQARNNSDSAPATRRERPDTPPCPSTHPVPDAIARRAIPARSTPPPWSLGILVAGELDSRVPSVPGASKPGNQGALVSWRSSPLETKPPHDLGSKSRIRPWFQGRNTALVPWCLGSRVAAPPWHLGALVPSFPHDQVRLMPMETGSQVAQGPLTAWSLGRLMTLVSVEPGGLVPIHLGRLADRSAWFPGSLGCWDQGGWVSWKMSPWKPRDQGTEVPSGQGFLAA